MIGVAKLFGVPRMQTLGKAFVWMDLKWKRFSKGEYLVLVSVIVTLTTLSFVFHLGQKWNVRPVSIAN